MEFRFRAMRQAHDPNNLDATVNLASPRAWIAVWVALFVVLAAGVWSFLGTIPQSVAGAGVLTRQDSVIRLQAGVSGVVTALTARPGQEVTGGAQVAVVQDGSGTAHRLLAPATGTVLLADYPVGTAVDPTDQIVVLERADGDGHALQAAVLLPQSAAVTVYPGLAVSLSVSVVPASQFGLLRGVVRQVSGYPATAQGLSSLVLDGPVAGAALDAGPMRLVIIDLVPDPATRSGYAWTSVTGPPFPLQFQDEVHATVHLPDRAPIRYLLGDL